MKFKDIKIGDKFPSILNDSIGSNVIWSVVSKDKGKKLIEVKSSYQHPNLPKTYWFKPSAALFKQKKVKNP